MQILCFCAHGSDQAVPSRQVRSEVSNTLQCEWIQTTDLFKSCNFTPHFTSPYKLQQESKLKSEQWLDQNLANRNTDKKFIILE